MEFIEKQVALKEIKTNIINWYDFKDNSKLLEIGENLEEITEKLCLKLSEVVLVGTLEDGYVDRDNLKVINDDIENVELEEKFDYILIKDNIEKIATAKKYLKPDGTMILILNNRLGITYFAGANGFQEICEDNSGLFTRREIEDILQNQGFSNYKFFYPLPNYKITNVIFSDDYLPEYNNTKLMNNNIYNEDNTVVFDELKALKQLTKVGEFKNFTNSYFVEINPKTEIKFASFNNTRKKEYRLCTKLYNHYVVKESTNEESKKHILNMKKNIQSLIDHGFEIIDKEENEKIISKYISQKSLYQIILEKIAGKQVDDAYNLIEKWFEYIKSKFINDKTNNLNKKILVDNQDLTDLTIVKNAYIDLVFENTFVIDNKFVFFDQEWVVDELPLEFILYRAINNIYIYNSEIEDIIPREDIFEKFSLLKYLNIFETTEEIIQSMIIDNEIIQIYNSSREKYIEKLTKEKGDLESRVGLLETEEKVKEKYIDKLTKEKGNLEARVGLLEAEEKKKEDYIEKLSQENNNKANHINELEAIKLQQEETINNLNEIIKVKDNQIEIYENMRAVKLVKKLRGKK